MAKERNAVVIESEETEEPTAQKYEVLVSFTDSTDGTVYWAGSLYPVDGVAPGAERIAALLGTKNAFGKPVIR